MIFSKQSPSLAVSYTDTSIHHALR